MSSGDYTWASSYENGVWTYSLDEVWTGLRAALSGIERREAIDAMGVSAMMHGYLAFDENWDLLVPLPHLAEHHDRPCGGGAYGPIPLQHPPAVERGPPVPGHPKRRGACGKIAHITTLAGYVHYRLTGVNAVGVGEASGMFPIDSDKLCYDKTMLQPFDGLVAGRNLPWKLEDILPEVLPAGAPAGVLTEQGAKLLDGLLSPGIPFAPPEGDAGTGMTATNAVAPRTGNVSAGTSIFSMVVLERPLKKVHEEIDLVTTPAGRPVAMVHCNNCTNDTNAWASVLAEAAELFGAKPSTGELFTRLYEKSMEGEADCGGVLVCNYLAGEGVTHLDSGRPLVVRGPEARFTLANFLRAQLYAHHGNAEDRHGYPGGGRGGH